MYQKIVLSNGVRLLTEYIDHVRSAAIGIWVGNGSRHERPEQQGISHFIEHMVFKGTETRTAAQQAMDMDFIGGNFNAYTSKEHTCFYARALDSHLPQAMELLFDLFFHAKFDETDIAIEKNVILEEISMYEDSPEDLCVEQLFTAVYRGNALGRPILGRPKTLDTFTQKKLRNYQKTHYRPEQTVVTLVGRYTQQDVDRICQEFSKMKGEGQITFVPAVYRPVITTRQKEIEQNHLCFAFPGLPFQSPHRFTLQLLTSILGGGMSSRIFQTVREQLGLCYNIYSFGAMHDDTGLFCIYAALSQETEAMTIETVCQLIKQFLEEGPTEEELSRVREQTKAGIFLGMESILSRMNFYARSELREGNVLSEDEMLAGYDAVTTKDVLSLARELFDFKQMSLSAVGNVRTHAQYKALLRPFMKS